MTGAEKIRSIRSSLERNWLVQRNGLAFDRTFVRAAIFDANANVVTLYASARGDTIEANLISSDETIALTDEILEALALITVLRAHEEETSQ